MTARLCSIILLAIVAFLPACEDDPAAPPPPDNSPKILPLTSREAVLNNLEVGWNKRSPSAIDDLLDDNFTFYFDPADVGGEIPSSWTRLEELAATEALFVSDTPSHTTGPVCRRVYIDIESERLTWVDVPVPASASGETWYTATVPYVFVAELEGDKTYANFPGAKAELTVREVDGKWRLVAWRDLASNDPASTRATGSTQVTTWGAIKSLYRGFLPLASRAAVLNNLEFAWNTRLPDKIDELLDDNFVFFFAPGDVGGSIPEQWGRANELATSTALLMSNSTPPTVGPVCTSVLVDIQANNVQWLEVIPEDFPTEVWYTATVVYRFTFEMESDQTYSNSSNAKAQLTVREVEGEWRLVEWRDLGSNLLTATEPSLAVAEPSWGKIKALYF